MKDFKTLWISGLAGMGFGFLVQLLVSLFSPVQVNGWLMLVLIAGGAVGAYFIQKNNPDLLK